MATIRILDPVGERRVLPPGVLREVDTLTGRTVGLLSNEWRCVKIMFDHLARALPERYGVRGTVRQAIAATIAGPPEVLLEMARRSDAVIVAMAN